MLPDQRRAASRRRGARSHDGVAAAVVSGFHHAHADHGEGFCTFNGLVVAAEALRAAGEIRTVAVLDMDLHYGNGTASLATTRPWLLNVSLYGNDYQGNKPYPDVSVLHHEDGANHRSIALPNGCRRDGMLAAMEQGLPLLLAHGRPDLLLYQAGADPYREDPYSPLELDHDDLQERDRRVFAFAKAAGPADRLGAGRRLHRGHRARSCRCTSTPSPRRSTSTACRPGIFRQIGR